MADFYNKIFSSGKLPYNLSSSIIVPLVKSYKKSLNSANNYRGISLIPTMTKLLDKRKIHHYSYICSLDAEKAFDSCDWKTLFYKLQFNKNLPTTVINVLKSLYSSASATISYYGKKSYQFNLSQGVRQGSILSPYFYNIYTEDLLSDLQKSLNVGTRLWYLYGHHCVRLMILFLLSTSLSSLQKMVDYCVSYGLQNKIKFNADKTEFIISGLHQPDSFFYLDGQRIKPSLSLKHLGFKWSPKHDGSSLQDSHVAERVSELWAVTDASIRSGIRSCHPYTIGTLYIATSIVVPHLLYGLELCELNHLTLTYLNTQARSALKSLFKLSKFSRNLLHKALNINPISDIIVRNKIKLFTRLLVNSFTNKTTKELILSELTDTHYSSSFIIDTVNICKTLKIDFHIILATGKIDAKPERSIYNHRSTKRSTMI